jgi:hypothetical protein
MLNFNQFLLMPLPEVINLVIFRWVAEVGTQSWQNVNSMNYRLEFWVVYCVVFSGGGNDDKDVNI